MFFDGNSEELLSVLREKKQCITEGRPHDHIRPLLVICGGVLKGAYGGGAVSALHEEGFSEVFDWVVGSSTGAPTACYFLSGQPWLGTSIYWEECCTRKFMDKRRFITPCDTEYISQVFRGLTGKGLDVEKVLQHRSKLLLAVTNYSTARQSFVTPKNSNELFSALHSSIAIPGATKAKSYINGERHVDGSYSNPMPVRLLIGRLQPTHVLVLSNRERKFSDATPFIEVAFNATMWRARMSPAVRRAAKLRRALLARQLHWAVTKSPVPTVVMWGDGSVGSLTQNSSLLQKVCQQSKDWWLQFLGGPM